MKFTPCPEEIRGHVAHTFSEMGVQLASPADLHESIVIEYGVPTVRTYEAGGYRASWLSQIGAICVSDASGNTLRMVSLVKEVPATRYVA